ncbi:MAG: glycine cleavage T C-terminal barrel domain-containing protein, partial [Pikeienuella sp.]
FVVMEGREFIGRESLVMQKAAGGHHVLATLKLPSGDTAVIADEGVYRDGKLIGRVTSGGYSYQCGHDIAMAMLPPEFAAPGTEMQISVHSEMRPAEVVDICLYDPTSARARA